MITTSKLNNIGKIYPSAQNPPMGAPPPGEDRPSAILPVDRVTLSKQALEASPQNRKSAGVPNEQELTPEEKEVVQDLKQRDAEVKSHEQAHMSAGAGVASGGATYEYQTGPDGRMYAIGGEVQIDLSSAGSPDATIRKMQQIQAAALAPAQPSGTDRAVAAQASQIEALARMEKSQLKKEEEEQMAAAPLQRPDESDPSDVATQTRVPTSGRIDLMA